MTTRAIAATAAKGIVTASLLIGLASLRSSDAQVFAAPISDDSPQWSCVDDGNRVCGPGNSNGVPAGCYDDGGVLWAVWPCAPWVPADGYRHADGTITFV